MVYSCRRSGYSRLNEQEGMEIIAVTNHKGEVGKTTSYGLKIYENRRDGLMT